MRFHEHCGDAQRNGGARQDAPGATVAGIRASIDEIRRRLPRTRLLDLLDRYRGCLEQAAALYQGQLHTLKDGSSLMLSIVEPEAGDYFEPPQWLVEEAEEAA